MDVVVALQLHRHTFFGPHHPSFTFTPPLRRPLIHHHLHQLSATVSWRRNSLPTILKACPLPQHSPVFSHLHPLINNTVAIAVSKLLVLQQAIHGAIQTLAMKQPQAHELESLADLRRGLLRTAAPLCFAAMSRPATPINTPLTVVASGMAKWLELYSGVLMVRVLLSWFPNIPWERQPLQAMRDMCDPYLNLFRNILPPLFNVLDLSPLLAFLVLGLLASILNASIKV